MVTCGQFSTTARHATNYTRWLFLDEFTPDRCLTAEAPQGATVRTVAAMLPRSPPVHASSTMSKTRALTG